MIKRLGLVIHWLGFLIGCGFSLLYLSLFFSGELVVDQPLDILGILVFIIGMPIICLLPACGIRWLLTGEKVFFPWRNS
jgi:hypothetical protein